MKLGLTRIDKEVVFDRSVESKRQIQEKIGIYRWYLCENCLARTGDFQERDFVLDFNFMFDMSIQSVEDLVYTVAEDICILQLDSDNEYRLKCALIGFPNRWRPREKIGLSIPQIHGPVPGFEAAVSSLNTFLKHLKVGQFYRRQNWGLCKSNKLYLPYDVEGDTVYKRVEFQTLFKISKTQLVFLIRTEIQSIDEQIRGELVSTLSPKQVQYKLQTSLQPHSRL